MSGAIAQPDQDFWEFANCGRCQLPFTLPSGKTVPFWLTECGHIICNNHLNADQSCSVCGAPGIQLVPLQREMEAPMSEWFQSVPIALDSLANAAKFQHEAMAVQIRHHRSRHQQQRALIERLRHDVGDLKKLNEQLQDENNRLRQHMEKTQLLVAGSHSEQQETLNVNGKRPHTGVLSYNQTRDRATTSSPRSIPTPLGPNRLTLPHGQIPPNLISNDVDDMQNPPSTNNQHLPSVLSQHRPTSAFIHKYAYVPPATPQFHRPQLTHAQITPRTFKRTKPNPESRQAPSQQPLAKNQAARSMPPPPTPAKFGAPPASTQFIRQSQTQDLSSGYSDQRRGMVEISSQTTRLHQSEPQARQNDRNSLGTIASHSSSGSNRFFPQCLVPPSTSMGQISTVAMGNGPQRFFPAGTRVPSRAPSQPADHSGQRVPFLSRDQLGNENYI